LLPILPQPPWRLTLSSDNLLDEEYFWNGDTSTAATADSGRPQRILLTASFRYGQHR
jgi:hypothetical protein